MKILLFFICFSLSFSLNAQSLRDSLFSGKLKADSGGFVKPAVVKDSAIFISVDTTQLFREKMEKEWKRFVETQTPIVEPNKKLGTNKGQFKALVSFTVEPDGIVTFIKAECDQRVSFLEPEFEKMFKKAPKLIPSHKDGLYVKSIRKIGFVVTIEKRIINYTFFLLNSLTYK